jgi:hypothetical protein
MLGIVGVMEIVEVATASPVPPVPERLLRYTCLSVSSRFDTPAI